jgi:hypothetical protein
MKRQQLPPEKLRALISLYHQSDTFITQENLLDKINEALIPQNKDYSTRQTMPGIEKMYEALAERRKFSKVGPPLEVTGAPAAVGISSSSPNGTWSSGRHARERRVIEALYGVDMSNPEKVKPGLELLEGVVEGLDKEAAEDAKNSP